MRPLGNTPAVMAPVSQPRNAPIPASGNVRRDGVPSANAPYSQPRSFPPVSGEQYAPHAPHHVPPQQQYPPNQYAPHAPHHVPAQQQHRHAPPPYDHPQQYSPQPPQVAPYAQHPSYAPPPVAYADSSQPQHFGAQPGAHESQPLNFGPNQGSQPQHFAQPSFPPHFAPGMQGAPPTARSSVAPRRPSAFPSEIPMPPPEPAAIMAASVFLGLPLALATLVVAVLALR